jgi:gluconolactonase
MRRPTVNPELLAEGFVFSEGPAIDASGDVFFSDCPVDTIYVYRTSGHCQVWRRPSGRANGMAFDHLGRLVACCDGKDGGARDLRRFEPDGQITVLASQFQGHRLNSPNDLCIDSRGAIWFSDPRYGYVGDLEQDCMGVYQLNADGTLTRVIDDMETPNGLALSEDETTLYVVDHNPEPGGARTVVSYHVDVAGACRRSGVLHDFGTGYGGDGMALDAEGTIYVAAGDGDAAGIYVIDPSGGLRDVYHLPETPGNCVFGGTNGTDLYVTASTSLYRLRLDVPGLVRRPQLLRGG